MRVTRFGRREALMRERDPCEITGDRVEMHGEQGFSSGGTARAGDPGERYQGVGHETEKATVVRMTHGLARIVEPLRDVEEERLADLGLDARGIGLGKPRSPARGPGAIERGGGERGGAGDGQGVHGGNLRDRRALVFTTLRWCVRGGFGALQPLLLLFPEQVNRVAQRDLVNGRRGRFHRFDPDALVTLTWVTGADGTAGAETLLTVQIDAIAGEFTRVTLTHEGFTTAETRDAHEVAWPMILARQDVTLQSLRAVAPTHNSPLRNRSIPDATFIPVRSYPDLDAAVTWLREVLGARVQLRVPQHRVQLTVGNGAVVVVAWDAAAMPATGGRPPAVLMVRVPNVDTAYARALTLGATGLTPPTDHPYGERQASVRDPAGHAWMLTQTIADVDPASWGGELVE